MTIGTKIIKLDSVGSTNDYALELLKTTTPENGTIVWAKDQIKGKGQHENIWESEPGKNLTFSIILYPTFLKADQQFYLTKIISLSVRDYLKEFVPGVSIKWANDIYILDKKVTGILIENAIIRNDLRYSVTGIGININQETFPAALPNPVSLKLATGKTFDIESCLTELCRKLEVRYSSLQSQAFDALDRDYLAALYRFEKYALYESNGTRFKAKITGISPFGQLLMETDKNERLIYNYGEVTFLI